jgi:hypothetical protein
MCVWGHASATAFLVQIPVPLESSSSHTVTRASLQLLPGTMYVETWGVPLSPCHHLLILQTPVVTTTHDLLILHVQNVTTAQYTVTHPLTMGIRSEKYIV